MRLFEHKYGPQNINELLIDDEVINLINFLIEIKELNLLLYGEDQCGKTCIIKTIIKELKFRNILKDKNIFNLNHLNEQTFVQNMNDLKIFCSSAIVEEDIKVVMIDNIGDFNENNQQNLKNLIENSKQNIYFICSINNINDLIEPIQSKLLQIKCNGLNKKKVFDYIKNIIHKEKLNLSDSSINNILYHSGLNFNIIMKYIEKIFLLDETEELTDSFFTNIEKNHYNNFITSCKNNDLKKANQILINLSHKGFFFLDILEEFYQYIKKSEINYDFLHLICKYTDKFYDGYDDNVQYFFFTRDVIKILNS